MHLTDIDALRKHFDEIDTDHSGFIDKEELRVALHKAGYGAASTSQVDKIMTDYCIAKAGECVFARIEACRTEHQRLRYTQEAHRPALSGGREPRKAHGGAQAGSSGWCAGLAPELAPSQARMASE